MRCEHPAVVQIVRNTDAISDAYATFGVDRALALRGAGEKWGWPVLVIDGGTARALQFHSPKRRISATLNDFSDHNDFNKS